MIKSSKQMTISLHDTLALRLLRACPKAAFSMNLSEEECITLLEFRQMLSQSTRRDLQISRMNTPCVTCDERCILNALAASQKEDAEKLTKTLEWLVPKWAMSRLQEEFSKVAQLMENYDIFLDQHHIKAPTRREEAGLYAVIG